METERRKKRRNFLWQGQNQNLESARNSHESTALLPSLSLTRAPEDHWKIIEAGTQAGVRAESTTKEEEQEQEKGEKQEEEEEENREEDVAAEEAEEDSSLAPVTLKDILDQEDVIQECKNMNKKLVD